MRWKTGVVKKKQKHRVIKIIRTASWPANP